MKKFELSVRKTREYQRLLKEKRELNERITYYKKMGTSSPDDIIKEQAGILAKAISQIPETLMRKTVQLAIKLAIPKSPRGRKPLHTGG